MILNHVKCFLHKAWRVPIVPVGGLPAAGCRQVVVAGPRLGPGWQDPHFEGVPRWAGRDTEREESRCSPDQPEGRLKGRGGEKKVNKKREKSIEHTTAWMGWRCGRIDSAGNHNISFTLVVHGGVKGGQKDIQVNERMFKSCNATHLEDGQWKHA